MKNSMKKEYKAMFQKTKIDFDKVEEQNENKDSLNI